LLDSQVQGSQQQAWLLEEEEEERSSAPPCGIWSLQVLTGHLAVVACVDEAWPAAERERR